MWVSVYIHTYVCIRSWLAAIDTYKHTHTQNKLPGMTAFNHRCIAQYNQGMYVCFCRGKDTSHMFEGMCVCLRVFVLFFWYPRHPYIHSRMGVYLYTFMCPFRA